MHAKICKFCVLLGCAAHVRVCSVIPPPQQWQPLHTIKVEDSAPRLANALWPSGVCTPPDAMHILNGFL